MWEQSKFSYLTINFIKPTVFKNEFFNRKLCLDVSVIVNSGQIIDKNVQWTALENSYFRYLHLNGGLQSPALPI